MTKRSHKQLKKLQKLAEMKSLSAQSRLATALAKERQCQAAIDALEDERQRVLSEAPPEAVVARALTEVSWLRWVDQERRRLQIELAKSKIVANDLKANAQKSVGQENVAKTLNQRALKG